jgi:hypothetical protein
MQHASAEKIYIILAGKPEGEKNLGSIGTYRKTM